MSSQNYYQTIFDKAGDAIFIHDVDSAKILDVNQAAEQLTGFNRAQLLTMGVADISAHHQGFDFAHATSRIRQTTRSGVIKFEWLLQSVYGKQIPAEVCLKVIHIEGQAKVLALVRDISEIKQYQYALQSKDEYFKCLLESSADGIAILDAQSRLLYASPSLEKITGYRNRFALKKNVLNIIHPEDRAAVRQFLYRELFHPQEQTQHLNYRILHHNGQWRYHEASCKNLLQDPNIQGFLINFRDITERIEAENTVRAREKQLGHMSRCKTMGELSTALAHELNQPLAALSNYITGSILRIQNGRANTAETLDALNAALNQVQRVSHIIRSMRQFLKKGEANFKILQLSQLIQHLAPLIELKADQGKCTIYYELTPTPIYIHADETLFSQVMINLVFNAVDALQDNPEQQRDIYIRTWLHQGMARISIADNGPGLNGRNPEQLFESFYSSKIDSMGIGLTLSRSIVENHQGYLWVCEGTPGAIFNISLKAQERETCIATISA